MWGEGEQAYGSEGENEVESWIWEACVKVEMVWGLIRLDAYMVRGVD